MKLGIGKREWGVAALVVVAFIAGVIQSPYFLDFRYLLDGSSLYMEIGLLALGMTFVIIAGQIDLSVGSMMGLSACFAALLFERHWPSMVVLLATLAFGAGLGWLNGALVARLKLPSFIVTLGTMAAFRGIAHAAMGENSIKIPDGFTGIDMLKIPGLGVPAPLILFLVFAVAMGLLLHRTVFGRSVFGVGANARAALFSGVDVARVTTLVFVISGAFAGAAGLLIDSRLGVARYDHGLGLELDAITAVVLGGAAISGGVGSLLGTVLALVLVSLIRIGMGLANVTAEYQLAVIGLLLIAAVALGQYFERRSMSPKKVSNKRPDLKPKVV